ncbi:MAG: hypothetical protein GY894_11145 [Planctomycetes bacterium]|nr:hypothetical protein [Planctomycetota bacterium]MCP4839892.1 hypothetical protein [Planctomycetota bacterium]
MRSFALAVGVLAFASAAIASEVLNEEQELNSPPSEYGAFGAEVGLDGDTLLVCSPSNDTLGMDVGFCWILTRDWEGTFTQQQTLMGSDIGMFERFGYAAAISGDVLVVGSKVKVIDGLVDAGAAYVFERMDGEWVETAIITAPVPEQGALFSSSLDIDGDTIVVGARNAGSLAGAAWIYARDTSGDWVSQGELIGTGVDAGDAFGFSAAIQGDTALVSAPYLASCGGTSKCGGVFVFERAGGVWAETDLLVPDDIGSEDYFGWDCDLDDGSDRIIATSVYDDDNAWQAGAGYIWDKQGDGSWTQSAKLLPSDGSEQDNCKSCEVEGDTAVICSWYGNGDKGEAWVWRRNGDEWTEVAMLRASDGETIDIFGRSVALEGDTVVVGADWHDVDGYENAGAAYVFDIAVATLPTGACCSNDDCVTATMSDCLVFGGTYHGDDTDCDDVDCSGVCPSDIDGSGDVGVDDLLQVIGDWGPCP